MHDYFVGGRGEEGAEFDRVHLVVQADPTARTTIRLEAGPRADISRSFEVQAGPRRGALIRNQGLNQVVQSIRGALLCRRQQGFKVPGKDPSRLMRSLESDWTTRGPLVKPLR